MSLKFSCVHCGHRLKISSEQAGKNCKCPKCGQAFTAPALVPLPGAAVAAPSTTPGGSSGSKKRVRLILGARVAFAVLVGGILLAVYVYSRLHDVDQKLSDLSGDDPTARSSAVLWLAEADPQDSHRAHVTATLEPLIFDGDVRGNLDLDVVLRAYLRWANQDNVPSLIRMVENPNLPSWRPEKTGLVMETLGHLQDKRAADVLARKLSDPQLHDQAVDALKLLGPGAEDAVLDYMFAGDPATRQRAGDLLADYGTPPPKVIAEARRRLKSNDPDEQRAAAAWFADNPPDNDAEKARVAEPLAALLGDLSPEVNGVVLRALKLWATRDCLPQVVDYAQRLDKAEDSKKVAANRSVLIDVLAQFPDESAAGAIALQLKDPEHRAKAGQALLKLGPVANETVLGYVNHPDEGVRKEAGSLSRALKVAADSQLEQTLADVADARKARSRAALEHMARLRPDDANRAMVSKALNAPLLDTDTGIRDAALDAVRVWATQENSATLLQLLGGLRGERKESDAHVGDKVAKALISIGAGVEEPVLPLLKSPDGLVRREACSILAEIGTDKCLQALGDGGEAYATIDPGFYRQTQMAREKVMARE
jgi:hypothetical protein